MAKTKGGKKKNNVNDLNNPKPMQVLSSNSADAPFKGGIGKGYIAPQVNPEYFEPEEGLLKGTMFKELDDDYKIKED